jgi:LacI family transcriptional regulator
MPSATLNNSAKRGARKNDLDEVLGALEGLCASLKPGDVIPSHRELMQQFGTSERAVRWALDELRRQGVIIRRQGASTIVAERPLRGCMDLAIEAPSNTVIAIGPHDYSFFDRCMHLVLRQAESAGLTLVCRLCEPDSAPAAFHLGQPMAVLLFGYRLMPLGKRLQEEGHRVVIVGSPSADALPEVPCVFADQEQGGYLVVRHLLELGHQRIALGYDQQSLRWRGHERALREARAKGRVGVVAFSELSWDEVGDSWQRDPQLAAEYFCQPDAPTAVATWNDHAAAALLAVLTRAGVKVPEQVSLVGFDNLPEAQLVHPPLTSVDSAIEQQLQAALGLLTRPDTLPSSHTVVVLPTLIGRESSASAPKTLV